ncbi:MAG: hypothetical protein JRI47_08830, partial [Deltaproteobacteria bacterium]|nr:hypothetical protein [Deltaproteobacteria bacterium]
RLSTPGADQAATRAAIDRYASPSFEAAASKALLDYRAPAKAVPAWPVGYLIISDPDFVTEMQPLADWKHSKGYEATLTSTADIPGGATTTAIKAYIQDAYDNWTVPPAYVLLVGDVADIPNWVGSGSDNPPTDLYYGTMTTPDYIPDLGVGRFSVITPAQAANLVERTVEYEKQLFSGTDWIKKAVFMASTDNYSITEGTHNYVISTYLDPAGYTYDKLYTYTHNATTQDVSDAFNDGRCLGVYSGHGATTYWADGPVFYASDVQALTNLDMYPFVQSYACITGEYDYGECFSETWIRQPDKAALVFWASSVNSFWDEDDVLEKGVFKALFEDGLTWTTGMTDQGKWYTYEHYSGGGDVLRYYEMYNTMGDPSLQVWTDTPAAMTVTHTGVCPLGSGTYSVHVADAGGDLADALVCLNMPGEVYENGYTDANGDIILTLDPPPAAVGEMDLTVTSHNYTPVIETIQVVVPAFVTIDPDTIQVETPTAVTVTVTDTLYAPIENIIVTIDGWGIDPALVDTTDATGTAVITVDAPYGEVLSVVGRKIGDAYDSFDEPLVVAGALALPDPLVTARVDAVGLTGALTPHYEGTIVGHTSHTGLEMFAVGSGIDAFISSPDDSAVINATPTSLGDVTVTLAYPGYEIYVDAVSVIETYGMLSGTVTDAVSGDSLSGALVSVFVAGSDTSTATPVFEITTGAAGDYAAPDSIPVGPYDVYTVKFG